LQKVGFDHNNWWPSPRHPYQTITIAESPFRFIYVGDDDGCVHVTKDGGAI
jgi:hypothetical protein